MLKITNVAQLGSGLHGATYHWEYCIFGCAYKCLKLLAYIILWNIFRKIDQFVRLTRHQHCIMSYRNRPNLFFRNNGAPLLKKNCCNQGSSTYQLPTSAIVKSLAVYQWSYCDFAVYCVILRFKSVGYRFAPNMLRRCMDRVPVGHQFKRMVAAKVHHQRLRESEVGSDVVITVVCVEVNGDIEYFLCFFGAQGILILHNGTLL